MPINLSPAALESIRELRQTKKYVEEDLYPGAPTEEIRIECERKTNEYLDRALEALKEGTSRQELFGLTEELFESFEEEDTEEREKVGDYVGSLMRAVGIEDWTNFV